MIELKHNGQTFEVPDDRVWGLIEAIEKVITLYELGQAYNAGHIPVARVYRAYAEALKYAGARRTTGDDVRKDLDAGTPYSVAGELLVILAIALPPSIGGEAEEVEVSEDAKKKD